MTLEQARRRDKLPGESYEHGGYEHRSDESALSDSPTANHGERRRHDWMNGHSKVEHGIEDDERDAVHSQVAEILSALRP